MSLAKTVKSADEWAAQFRVSASVAEKSDLIEGTQWGRDFTFEQIQRIAGYMDLCRVKKATTLFTEGDKASYFILIIKGRIDVLKSDANHHQQKISTLGPGKTLGEMNLVDGEPRSADAVTLEEVTFLIMTLDSFKQLSQELPRVSLVMVLKIAKQMSQFLRLTSGKLVDYMSN